MNNNILAILALISFFGTAAAQEAIDFEQTIEVVAEDEAFPEPVVDTSDLTSTTELAQQQFDDAAAAAEAAPEERGDVFATGETTAGSAEEDNGLFAIRDDDPFAGLDVAGLDSVNDALDTVTDDLDDAVTELAELSEILDLLNLRDLLGFLR